mgnify:CR=1 FL=1
MGMMIKGIIGGDEFSTEALVRGLTIHGPADAYYVSHCSDQLSSRLQAKCGVHAIKNIADLIPRCAVLFLTFLPEEASALLPKIAEKVKEWTLIVSSVHDLKLATLEYYFPNNEIVRLVCNPSIMSGAGLSAYAVSRNASTDAKSMAEIVLKECGDVIAVETEDELENVAGYLAANTYFSYVVIQTMIRNAKQLGMTPKEALSATNKLLKGSLHTLIDVGYDTSDLISRGFNDKFVHDTALELIKNYGIEETLMKELTQPEPEEEMNPNDDPKNYKMHYQWSR